MFVTSVLPMIDTFVELMEYLDDRGAKYGIEGIDIYNEIPIEARDPEVAYAYMQQKDISHIEPLSKGGERAGDNWFLEDSDFNRSRGAETATEAEQAEAKADGHRDAKQLLRVGTMGAAMAAGQVIVEGALVAAETGIGMTIAPVIATVAAVGAAGYGTYRVVKHARKNKWSERFQTFKSNCSFDQETGRCTLGTATFLIPGQAKGLSTKADQSH